MARLASHPLTNSQLTLDRFRHDGISHLLAVLQVWGRRIRERRELANLGERELRDIGLTHADADAVIAKPFWRK